MWRLCMLLSTQHSSWFYTKAFERPLWTYCAATSDHHHLQLILAMEAPEVISEDQPGTLKTLQAILLWIPEATWLLCKRECLFTTQEHTCKYFLYIHSKLFTYLLLDIGYTAALQIFLQWNPLYALLEFFSAVVQIQFLQQSIVYYGSLYFDKSTTNML